MVREEDVKTLLSKANDDLLAVKQLTTNTHPVLTEIVCYHCQQAAEKFLKAYIFAQGKEPRKIHDLLALLEVCETTDPAFNFLSDKCAFLSNYGSITRYSYELQTGETEMKVAIHHTNTIKDFILPKIDKIMEEGVALR